MSTARGKRTGIAATAILTAAIAMAGCSSDDPLGEERSSDAADGAIVVGSQAYYSNEIIAEIYAQALEAADFEVDRQFTIGQRDAYMPELESGAITLFPEYTGNLLQFFDAEAEARSPEDVYAALQEALPEGLTVLDQSSATDQDSYTVTRAFADDEGLTSIADLANASVPITLGGPPELSERPYGPTGLESTYGVEVEFSATGDTTVEDLLAGTVNVANVYTADPRIQTDDLVVLEDPESLFLASNVVPLVDEEVADDVAAVINAVSAALTPEGLVALNVLSTEEEQSTPDIAAKWLSDNGLV
ncbi:ABC transporter substrate-binding protein [Glycomyces sp. NPDC046736]|uniref:ABC transporter substrate-binding protein n=1 Tax=Glycomyces sp. NPDC046736 TaxID=3155615 RepID=UPI0033CE7E79